MVPNRFSHCHKWCLIGSHIATYGQPPYQLVLTLPHMVPTWFSHCHIWPTTLPIGSHIATYGAYSVLTLPHRIPNPQNDRHHKRASHYDHLYHHNSVNDPANRFSHCHIWCLIGSHIATHGPLLVFTMPHIVPNRFSHCHIWCLLGSHIATYDANRFQTLQMIAGISGLVTKTIFNIITWLNPLPIITKRDMKECENLFAIFGALLEN